MPTVTSPRLDALQARLAQVRSELASLRGGESPPLSLVTTPYDGVTTVSAPQCRLPSQWSNRFSLTLAT